MSYTLKYTGAEIDDILDRAVEGGTIDEALALKAPLESPALTGTPTAPTPAESDNSTKVATTAYADRAAAGAAAAAYPVDTASGSVASFSDGADGIVMKSFVASIEPIQAGSGDPSPDNIRAITGHTGINAVVAGVNLFNIADVFSGTGQSVSGTTITKEYSGYYFDLLNGTTGSTATATEKIYLPAGTYTISGTYTGTGSVRVYTCDADGVVASTHIAAITSSISSQSFTLAAASYITMRYGDRNACTTENLQIEVGESASTCEAYKGTTYPVDWTDEAGTVYKGSIDLVSGVLTATHAIVTYTGSDSWAESGNRWYKNASSLGVDTSKLAESICNQAAYNDTSDLGAYFCFTSAPRIYLNKLTSGEVLTDVQTRLTANPLQVVYPLATQLVYNLTPTQVLSLLGQNNCFNDCGDTAVEYRADIALYVQKLLGGNVNTLSMSAPTPSLSLGRTGVLLEPEVLEPVITEDAEPDLAEEEPEAEEE